MTILQFTDEATEVQRENQDTKMWREKNPETHPTSNYDLNTQRGSLEISASRTELAVRNSLLRICRNPQRQIFPPRLCLVNSALLPV